MNNTRRLLQFILRRRSAGIVIPTSGGGGATPPFRQTWANLAQAARAAAARFSLSVNQSYPTDNFAEVQGAHNTTLGLPALETNYSRNYTELQDTNGVAVFAASATAKTVNNPTIAAIADKIWLKGRTRIDEIIALASSTGAGEMCIDDGTGSNKKVEVYWTMGATAAFQFSLAIYMTGSTRATVLSSSFINTTPDMPPAGCFLDWSAGYDSTTGTLKINVYDDAGTALTDGTRTLVASQSCFPTVTGSLTLKTTFTSGATSIVLQASTLTGSIVIGSVFSVGGVNFTATAAATASSNAITIPVASTTSGANVGAAAAFVAGPALNTDGGANGVVNINKAFNGAAHSVALCHAGTAVYHAAIPTTTAVLHEPAQTTDSNFVDGWAMGDQTSGAMTALASMRSSGGNAQSVVGTVTGAFDNGSMNSWPCWPMGPGGIMVDENQWKEFHFISGITGSVGSPVVAFNFSPDATVTLARGQGTASRAYMFEGTGTSLSAYTTYANNSTNALGLLQAIVNGLVGHYVAKYGTAAQGGVREWNVVNEWLQGGSLQTTPWSTQIGSGWVVDACVAVHAADPTAMIMLNLDNIEGAGNTSQQSALRTAVSALITAGIPAAQILAMHEFHQRTDTGYSGSDASAFLTHVHDLAALGVWWGISEWDMTDVSDEGATGVPNVAARPAREALSVNVFQELRTGILQDATAWASLWSMGPWQLASISSWLNTNNLAGSERTDDDFEEADLLDENYGVMQGTVDGGADVYGHWMDAFADHA